MSNLLTTQEASERLGVSARRVIALIEAGRLPASRFGKAYAIKEADLELVAERTVGRPAKETAAPAKKQSNNAK